MIEYGALAVLLMFSGVMGGSKNLPNLLVVLFVMLVTYPAWGFVVALMPFYIAAFILAMFKDGGK